MESTHGTSVNGQRLARGQQVLLHPGDHVLFGHSQVYTVKCKTFSVKIKSAKEVVPQESPASSPLADIVESIEGVIPGMDTYKDRDIPSPVCWIYSPIYMCKGKTKSNQLF